MPAVVSTYVEFYGRGMMLPGGVSVKVQHEDPTKVVVPHWAFGFRFYQLAEDEAVLPSGERVPMQSPRIHLSPMYYLGGEVFTIEQVQTQMPGEHLLLENMHRNGWKRVLYHRFGGFVPLQDHDVVLPLPPAT